MEKPQQQSQSSITFWHRAHKQYEIEKIYGDKFLKWLYQSTLGKKTGALVSNAYFSKAYGAYQALRISHSKVRPFISKFDIEIDEFEPGSLPAADIRDSYATFNEFFIRKFKLGKRNFVPESHRMPALAEARYIGVKEVTSEMTFPVKGKYLSAEGLLGNKDISKIFEGGPLVIARLCPVDYHRYHYPDNGKVVDHYRVKGQYHSVNPLALREKNDIFIANERYVSILQTENFGRLAYIEVGAICVGKIVQTHPWNKPFTRGQEKGYFLFGGSTVVLLGEKGKWAPSADICENTAKGLETYLQIGDEVGVRN